MGTKKHGSKKEGLSIESNKKEPQRLTWKSKYEQICATHVTNGSEENDAKEEDEVKSNALDGLSGYLSSDSSSGESELNEEVQNFLKEVDVLYEEDRRQQLLNATAIAAQSQAQAVNNIPSADTTMQQYDQSSAPTVAWQECYDSNTGYTYYWNMETNEVTWDMPPEYQTYMEALKQWQQYQAQGVAALLQARVQHQIQQQQLLLQQAHETQQTVKHETSKAHQGNQRSKRKSEKKSDSEDEKIELITSYGPYSEEESSDTEKKTSKTPKPREKKRKTEDKPQDSKPMGPQLPKNKIRRINRPLQLLRSSLVPYHNEGESDTEEQSENSKSNSVSDKKPQNVEKHSPEHRSPAHSPIFKKDEAVSSPAKEDEEDENILLNRLKSQTQLLKELGGEIPDEVKSIIVDSNFKEDVKDEELKAHSSLTDESKNLKLKLSTRAKKLINISSTTAKARATEFIQTPDGLKPVQKKEEGESDLTCDANEANSKKKLTRLGMPTFLLSNEVGKNTDVKLRDENNRGGFGFVASIDDKKKFKTDKIAFIKADILHLSEEDKGTDIPLEEIEESAFFKESSTVLLDKMKFLSDRKEPVPLVQVWAIQLETLLSAWESKCLKKSYLEEWLNKTRKELETLEGTVAPDGWKCEWQREEKRYQYVKTSTGEVSWEFPAVSVGDGGEEEMDISTTPPPLCTPPPPQISIPSPPSPPSISYHTSCHQTIEDVPPLPADIPPLPPLPPPEPPLPPPSPPSPPPLPQSPPPPLLSSQPLPPGVEPNELPPLPPVTSDFTKVVSPSPVYPPFFQAYPSQQIPSPQPPLPPSSNIVLEPVQQIPASSHDLSSELDNFYNDIASLEPEQPPLPPEEPPPPPPSSFIPPPTEIIDKDKFKKKKKTKLTPGLSLKKKGVSSLVAKWQQVQEDVRRDMKHD